MYDFWSSCGKCVPAAYFSVSLCNSKENILYSFHHCTEIRYFSDRWYIQRVVASNGIGGDWEDHGFSTSYFIQPFYVWFLIQLRQMCSCSLFFNPSAIIPFFILFCWKTLVFLITFYPFTRHHSPYIPAINKMPSLCAMAKECDIFSFELHSNMLKLHWNCNVLTRDL